MGWTFPKAPTPEFSGSAADIAAIKVATQDTAARLLSTGAVSAANLLAAMHSTNGFGYAAGPVTAVYSTCAVGVSLADGLSSDFPDHCHLSALDIACDTLAGGFTTLTCYLSEDAAGLYPICHPSTIPLVLGTTAVRYVASYLVERERRLTGVSTLAGKLYLQVKGNAGTCNLVARLGYLP
jgi:hypothetical protein